MSLDHFWTKTSPEAFDSLCILQNRDLPPPELWSVKPNFITNIRYVSTLKHYVKLGKQANLVIIKTDVFQIYLTALLFARRWKFCSPPRKFSWTYHLILKSASIKMKPNCFSSPLFFFFFYSFPPSDSAFNVLDICIL